MAEILALSALLLLTTGLVLLAVGETGRRWRRPRDRWRSVRRVQVLRQRRDLPAEAVTLLLVTSALGLASAVVTAVTGPAVVLGVAAAHLALAPMLGRVLGRTDVLGARRAVGTVAGASVLLLDLLVVLGCGRLLETGTAAWAGGLLLTGGTVLTTVLLGGVLGAACRTGRRGGRPAARHRGARTTGPAAR